VSNIWSYLNCITRKIILHQPWTIPKIRQNDRHIMNDLIKDQIPEKDLCILNNCRVYLQITTLAEITNHKGKHLISEALYSKHNESPSLREVSKSKYNWPNQNNPGKKAWRLWTRTIWRLYTKLGLNSLLKIPLDGWLHTANMVQQWRYSVKPTTKKLYSNMFDMQSINTMTNIPTNQTHLYIQYDPTAATQTVQLDPQDTQ